MTPTRARSLVLGLLTAVGVFLALTVPVLERYAEPIGVHRVGLMGDNLDRLNGAFVYICAAVVAVVVGIIGAKLAGRNRV